MTWIPFRDTMTLTDAASRKTPEGFLMTSARVARTGIQVYGGAEVGRPDLAQVRVYRPDSTVFSVKTADSFAHRTVTLGHPDDQPLVDSKNWSKVTVGITGDEVLRDGQFMVVPFAIMDAVAIAAVESGAARELSMGYDAELDWTPGVTDSGEKYDAVQMNLRMNHLAIVPTARGGSELRIRDSKEKDDKMTTKTILLDGKSYEVNDAAVTLVDALQSELVKVRKQLVDADAASTKEIATRDVTIENLKKTQVTDAQIMERVVQRVSLVGQAKALVPTFATDGVSDDNIRRGVVVALASEDAVKGKSQAYIDARFDVLVDNGTDPVTKAFMDAGGKGTLPTTDSVKAEADRSKAYNDYLNDMSGEKKA